MTKSQLISNALDLLNMMDDCIEIGDFKSQADVTARLRQLRDYNSRQTVRLPDYYFERN